LAFQIVPPEFIYLSICPSVYLFVYSTPLFRTKALHEVSTAESLFR